MFPHPSFSAHNSNKVLCPKESHLIPNHYQVIDSILGIIDSRCERMRKSADGNKDEDWVTTLYDVVSVVSCG